MKAMRTRRSRSFLAVVALSAALVASMFAVTGCVKVVKIGEEGELTGQKAFDAASEVSEMWDSKLMPELTGEAVDLGKLLTESDGKPSTVADTYGKGSSKNVFVVSGTGTVTSVKDGKSGALIVKPDGYEGEAEVKIQVGPIYRGTSIRDALSFVSAQDVTNQVEWADLSKSINEKVASDVVGKVDVASAAGKKVSFTGCFSGSSILITPVKLELS